MSQQTIINVKQRKESRWGERAIDFEVTGDAVANGAQKGLITIRVLSDGTVAVEISDLGSHVRVRTT